MLKFIIKYANIKLIKRVVIYYYILFAKNLKT